MADSLRARTWRDRVGGEGCYGAAAWVCPASALLACCVGERARATLPPPQSVQLRGKWGLTPRRLCAQWIASKNAAWWSAAAISMIAARSLSSLPTLAVPLAQKRTRNSFHAFAPYFTL